MFPYSTNFFKIFRRIEFEIWTWNFSQIDEYLSKIKFGQNFWAPTQMRFSLIRHTISAEKDRVGLEREDCRNFSKSLFLPGLAHLLDFVQILGTFRWPYDPNAKAFLIEHRQRTTWTELRFSIVYSVAFLIAKPRAWKVSCYSSSIFLISSYQISCLKSSKPYIAT